MICDTPTRARLEALEPLAIHEDGPMPDDMVERHLPETTAILGQTAMPAERLQRASKLRGLPPACCKRAERQTAGRMRSRPVERS